MQNSKAIQRKLTEDIILAQTSQVAACREKFSWGFQVPQSPKADQGQAVKHRSPERPETSTSTQQHPVQEEEEEDSPDEDGVGVDMATFTIAPADVTATSMTSAQSASTTATNMMGQLCWTDAASATASEVVMDMVEMCEEGNLNGLQDESDEPDEQGSEVVRVLMLRPVWTDVVFMQGTCNDTSHEVIEKGVFGNNKDSDISGNKVARRRTTPITPFTKRLTRQSMRCLRTCIRVTAR